MGRDEDADRLFPGAFAAVEFEPDPVAAGFEFFRFDRDPDLEIADRQALDLHVRGLDFESGFPFDPHAGAVDTGVGFALPPSIVTASSMSGSSKPTAIVLSAGSPSKALLKRISSVTPVDSFDSSIAARSVQVATPVTQPPVPGEASSWSPVESTV